MTDFIDSSSLSTEPPQLPHDMRGIGPVDGKKHSAWKTVVLFVVVLAIVLAGFLLYFRVKIDQPFKQNARKQAFVIFQGERLPEISAALRNGGLISNATIFTYYAKLSGKGGHVLAGQYLLSASMSMRQILDSLSSGKTQNDVAVVRIKEGERISEIADDLEKQGIVSKKDFLSAMPAAAKNYGFEGEDIHPATLEGYLFPDTYFVSKPVKASEIISKALVNFDKKLDAKTMKDIYAQRSTVFKIVTLASIIEKEVGRNTATLSDADQQKLDQERKIVAGIFYNRLRAGMPLQSDATITYITGKHDPSSSAADLQINSPYNTYKYASLPPGPIGNPSLSSILAAVYPAQTDYMYFLSKPDGTAVFAKTLDEQNKNKQLYLK